MSSKLPILLSIGLFCSFNNIFAQLNINGADFIIESGAQVTLQGDLTSTSNILGAGKLVLNGSANQLINASGFTIPNLEVNNPANATLSGDTRIGKTLVFTNGKLIASGYDLHLADSAVATGMGTNKFIETSGTGQVIKEITANVTAVEIPVGSGADYRPAFVTTTGTYSAASVGIKVFGTTDPNGPPSVSDYVSAYWPVTRAGITGTVTVEGQYADGDVTGTENNLKGYYFNGTDWSSVSGANVAATNRVSALFPANGDLAAMDKFDLLKTKVFLQGAYNSTTGVMSDALRAGTNLIPLTDPYRSAPYTTYFTHVANPVSETANASVFADQVSTDNNIVDWVFLELRNSTASPGNQVVQTRSALLTRAGNVVDVDGISPITFNNVPNGNYTIAVRHRNHLGISLDPSTTLQPLSETKSTATILDFTTATNNSLFGPADAYAISTDGKNMLWAGNANSNPNVRFIGLSNDKDYISITTLGNNVGQTLTNVYSPADVNMNRNVRYLGLSNDKDLILITSLANAASTQRIQALPN